MTQQTATKKPIERVLDLLSDAKGPKGEQEYYTARCPAHNDTSPSFSFHAIGDEHSQDGEGVVLTCYAGCSRQAILEALHLDEKVLHYRVDTQSRSGSQAKRTPTLTSIDLAEDKVIHPNLLDKWGVSDGAITFKGKNGKQPYKVKGVIIRYYDMDGHPYDRYRLRTHKVAKEGTVWNDDSTAPIIPYGLETLSKAREARELVLVEGESDVWTLRMHGISAIGIPGVTNIKCLLSEHIADIDRIYMIQEPDPAGQKFPHDVKVHLDKIGYKGKIYSINLWKEYQAKDPNDLHKQIAEKHGSVKPFKAMFETAMLHGKAWHKERPKPVILRLVDLQDRVLPATKWAIPDILPEGLTLLVGKPKLGKSWMLLALLQAIASGGVALGNIPVEQGQTLYISLEDNEKRLQKRINTLLNGDRAANDFLYATKWARLNEGGLEDLEQVIIDNPRLRLIGIDTWAKVKPRAQKGYQKQQYDEDYDALTPLQELAGKYGVAIVVVHHFRKMGSEDMIDQISGSTAMAGAVDNFLLLDRKRGETDAHLHAFGRDIEEEQDLIVEFNHDIASWVIKGDADDSTLAGTPQQQEILDLLVQHEQGLAARQIMEKLGKNSINTTRNLLQKLRKQGKLDIKNATWSVVKCSQDSYRSQRSQRSQAQDSEEKLTTPDCALTTPDYGSVVRDNTIADTPVAHSQNGYNSHLTTLTTLTIDVPLTPDKVIRYPQTGLGVRCFICKKKEAVSYWAGGKPYCADCKQKEQAQ